MHEITLQNETELFKSIKERDADGYSLLTNEKYNQMINQLQFSVRSIETMEQENKQENNAPTNEEPQENNNINTYKNLRQYSNSHALFKILGSVKLSERNKLPKNDEESTKVEPPKRKLAVSTSNQ